MTTLRAREARGDGDYRGGGIVSKMHESCIGRNFNDSPEPVEHRGADQLGAVDTEISRICYSDSNSPAKMLSTIDFWSFVHSLKSYVGSLAPRAVGCLL